jgi:hypothetical protein
MNSLASRFMNQLLHPKTPFTANLFRQTRVYSGTSSLNASKTSTSRMQALNDRRTYSTSYSMQSNVPTVPPSLRKLTAPLASAPVSHVTAFLILHEITAILPLVGLAATFHYTNWLPEGWAKSEWVEQGVQKWGRYLRKKGWIKESEKAENSTVTATTTPEQGVKLVLEVAVAWALVKMALPIRIAASVGLTPWFARRVILPIGRPFRRS